ncbi:hypothetical protein M196_gp50 [Halorubrum tailed virus 4]|uniref:HK97 gp10 family phage protein n=1 Tax=Halorubrum tailed virus 4 TaxID=1273752 RepID=R4TKE4_9CAUD|nr:hypothetical protein M196_gp50 [Halorubrum tailed virus 4]AGM11142.1 hypothetical protein HRTV4_50 [Halorubrum tailed virus 4]
MLNAEVNARIDVSAADVLEAHRDRIKKAADLGVSVAREEVPVDTGTLKTSIFSPEFRGDDVVYGATAGNAAPMEYGTQPGHRPPIRPLADWAERIGKDRGFGIYVATQVIPEQGVQAQPYLRPSVERMRPWLDNHGLDL